MNANRIVKSKRAFRRQLAARPIAEKLRMLDALRERAVTIGRASSPAKKPAASAHSAEK